MFKQFLGVVVATLGSNAGASVVEDKMFEAATAADTIQAYSVFVETFPNSKHATTAQERIAMSCGGGARAVTKQTGTSSWDTTCEPYS